MGGRAVLMWRCTGQGELALGTVSAGRGRRELEELVGFFVNTLVVRARVEGSWSFERVLEEVRESSLGAQAHDEVPFEGLIEALVVERDASRTPLFQVACVLQNAPEGELRLGEVRIDDYELASDVAKFDLSLALQEASRGLDGELNYRA